MLSDEVIRTWFAAWRANVEEDCGAFWVPVKVQITWVERGWVERERNQDDGSWIMTMLPAGEIAYETHCHECGIDLAIFDGVSR